LEKITGRTSFGLMEREKRSPSFSLQLFDFTKKGGKKEFAEKDLARSSPQTWLHTWCQDVKGKTPIKGEGRASMKINKEVN